MCKSNMSLDKVKSNFTLSNEYSKLKFHFRGFKVQKNLFDSQFVIYERAKVNIIQFIKPKILVV